jgi:hypothetical protein
MVTRKITLTELLKFRVKVTQDDINNGVCRKQSKCMEKVAVCRTLIELGVIKSDAEGRVRVDAGHIKFNAYGFRWVADTPKTASQALKAYDHDGPEVVRGHSYMVVAHKDTPIIKIPRERQEQINEARRARWPQENRRYKTIHERIVGY